MLYLPPELEDVTTDLAKRNWKSEPAFRSLRTPTKARDALRSVSIEPPEAIDIVQLVKFMNDPKHFYQTDSLLLSVWGARLACAQEPFGRIQSLNRP